MSPLHIIHHLHDEHKPFAKTTQNEKSETVLRNKTSFHDLLEPIILAHVRRYVSYAGLLPTWCGNSCFDKYNFEICTVCKQLEN